MKKIISFSLWGKNPKYTIGAVKNAKLANIHYPDWNCRFYCNSDVPEDIIKQLQDTKNTEVVLEDGSSDWTFSVKRFYPLSEENVSHMISRDTDSRLGQREFLAVQEWINSGKSCHIMRDHPQHGGFPMLAGMFGMKGGIVKNIKKLLELNKSVAMQYHYDQIFLANYVYPLIEDDKIVHDEYFEINHFPTPRDKKEYVGKPFDHNDQPVLDFDK